MLQTVPIELLAKIIQFLDGPSVLKLQESCKYFNETLSSLAEAKYNVLLFRLGMEDGPNTLLSIHERLTALEAYGRDRLHLNYTEHNFEVNPGSSGLRTARGLIWSWEGDMVFAYRLPYPQRGVTFRSWAVRVGDAFETATANSAIDLLIVVRRKEDSCIRRIYPKAMSTGTIHPLAERAFFEVDYAGRTLQGSDFQTYGKYILFIFHRTGTFSFVVYNWCNGAVVLTSPEMKLANYARLCEPFFFDSKCLMVARRTNGADKQTAYLTLALYSLESEGLSYDVPTLIFHLPEFSPDTKVIDLRAQSNGTRGGCFGDNAYFQKDVSNRLFTIDFGLQLWPHGNLPGHPSRARLRAFASSFVPYLARALSAKSTGDTVHVPFSEWGSHGVRLSSTDGGVGYPSIWVDPAADRPLTSVDDLAVRFFDYHIQRVAWAQHSGELDSILEGEAKIFVEKGMFESQFLASNEDLKTSLPFIDARSKPLPSLSLPDTHKLRSRIASGRYVILQYLVKATGLSYCRVLVF